MLGQTWYAYLAATYIAVINACLKFSSFNICCYFYLVCTLWSLQQFLWPQSVFEQNFRVWQFTRESGACWWLVDDINFESECYAMIIRVSAFLPLLLPLPPLLLLFPSYSHLIVQFIVLWSTYLQKKLKVQSPNWSSKGWEGIVAQTRYLSEHAWLTVICLSDHAPSILLLLSSVWFFWNSFWQRVWSQNVWGTGRRVRESSSKDIFTNGCCSSGQSSATFTVLTTHGH